MSLFFKIGITLYMAFGGLSMAGASMSGPDWLSRQTGRFLAAFAGTGCTLVLVIIWRLLP